MAETKTKARKKPTATGQSADSTRALRTLLKRMEERFESGEVKGTLADYLRLLQFTREVEDRQPRTVEVRWVDASEPASAGEK